MKKTLLIMGIITGLIIGIGYYVTSPSFEYAVIEQNVNLDSRIDCTYYIATYLWVKKHIFDVGTIEDSIYAYNVKKEDVETVREQQLKSMKLLKSREELS